MGGSSLTRPVRTPRTPRPKRAKVPLGPSPNPKRPVSLPLPGKHGVPRRWRERKVDRWGGPRPPQRSTVFNSAGLAFKRAPGEDAREVLAVVHVGVEVVAG